MKKSEQAGPACPEVEARRGFVNNFGERVRRIGRIEVEIIPSAAQG